MWGIFIVGMMDKMLDKAVKMQSKMIDAYEKGNPELYAEMTDKPIFCSYCGTKNDRKDKRCIGCGAGIKNT